MTQPDSQRYSNTALTLLNMFLSKLSPITQAEWKENNSNEDIAVNIYTLFISSIECHSRLLLGGLTRESSEHRNLYMGLIQEIINCTNKPGIYPVEESCSTLAMGFWYMLQVSGWRWWEFCFVSSFNELIHSVDFRMKFCRKIITVRVRQLVWR